MATILLVDDDPYVLQSLVEMMEDEGYSVSGFSHGQEAIDSLAAMQPDLIVLDIVMPEMDGLEVCRRLREHDVARQLPIVFLTAKGRPLDLEYALNVGGDDYLIKPFDVLDLPSRVEALLTCLSQQEQAGSAETLMLGDLSLDVVDSGIEVSGHFVDLTAFQLSLLRYLIRHAGQTLTADTLLREVWGYPEDTGDKNLAHAAVGVLRRKLNTLPDTVNIIHAVGENSYLLSEQD